MRSGRPVALRPDGAGADCAGARSIGISSSSPQRSSRVTAWRLTAGTVREPSGILFPHAEAREDPPEKILRRELARDLCERALRRAQLLGNELSGPPLGELVRGRIHVSACPG